MQYGLNTVYPKILEGKRKGRFCNCICKNRFSVHHWVIFFLLLLGFSGILGLSIYIPLNWKSKDCSDVYPHTGRTREMVKKIYLIFESFPDMIFFV